MECGSGSVLGVSEIYLVWEGMGWIGLFVVFDFDAMIGFVAMIDLLVMLVFSSLVAWEDTSMGELDWILFDELVRFDELDDISTFTDPFLANCSLLTLVRITDNAITIPIINNIPIINTMTDPFIQT